MYGIHNANCENYYSTVTNQRTYCSVFAVMKNDKAMYDLMEGSVSQKI